MPPTGFSKEDNRSEIVAFKDGKEERFFFKKAGRDGSKPILKSFIKKFKTELGDPAEKILAEDRDTIREERQRLVEAEKQFKQNKNIKKCKIFDKKPRKYKPRLMQLKMNRGLMLKVKQNCAG